MTAKKRRGYPAWLTEEAEAAVIKSVEAGNTITTSVAAAGIDPADLYTWASSAPKEDKARQAFRMALVTARAKAEQKMTDALVADASGGFLIRRYTKSFPNGQDEVDETYSQPNARAAMSWMQARNGQQWGKPELASDMLDGETASAVGGGAAQEQGTIEALAKRLHALRADRLREEADDDEPQDGHPVVAGKVLPPGAEA